MRVGTFAESRTEMHFGDQKINLHLAGHKFEPKANRPVQSSSNLCFITQTPIMEVVETLNTRKTETINGPAPRTGAIEQLSSVHCRDPDGKLIEFSNRSAK